MRDQMLDHPHLYLSLSIERLCVTFHRIAVAGTTVASLTGTASTGPESNIALRSGCPVKILIPFIESTGPPPTSVFAPVLPIIISLTLLVVLLA
jgi:hypothetical protein